MTIVPDETAPSEGLRERKRRQTRARIAETGLRLFLERGFEETTLDAIAKQADIARRTFFHYFDSKEAILVSLQDAAEEGMCDAIRRADADGVPFEAVCVAMLEMVAAFGKEEARAIDRLLRSTDALRARKQANYERQERKIFAALHERWPDPGLSLKLRLISLVCVGALRLAADAWTADENDRPFQFFLEEVFESLRGNVTR